jgi:tetratricopeptide (TPR) repeat protein
MKLIVSFFFTITILGLSSCHQRNVGIVKNDDVDKYIAPNEISLANHTTQATHFWNKRYEENPKNQTAIIKLAHVNAEIFQQTGELSYLKKSDSLFTVALIDSLTKTDVSIYHSMATNAITQHNFKLAKSFLDSALMIGYQKSVTHLMLVDVFLELGNVFEAKKSLGEITNKNSFAYLIRLAKVLDHEGDLSGAIKKMEDAYARIQNNKSLSCWALSNLGDMYGHAGRINDAYKAYLSALEINPNYIYALKGIAWIALSNDHNYGLAKEIILEISKRKRMPESHLLLAEIAELENNLEEHYSLT